MSNFFDEEKESLVAYYLLPILGFGFKLFGKYFYSAKISKDCRSIKITLYKECKVKIWDYKHYQTDWPQGKFIHVLFGIPETYIEDVKVFSEGKYSKLSGRLKRRIYEYSGLFFNKQIDNTIVTDMRLLALSKSPILRNWLVEDQGVELDKRSEFIKLKNKDSIYYD